MQVLFARHHVRVFRFVLRLVRNEATAEDLISEVFLDVWRQAGKFEGRSAVSTWLLAIARFKALSVLRRKPESELDEEKAEAIEDTADTPDVTLEKKEKADVIRKCFGRVVRRAPGGCRSGLLPREVRRGSCRDCGYPGSDGQNENVLRA